MGLRINGVLVSPSVLTQNLDFDGHDGTNVGGLSGVAGEPGGFSGSSLPIAAGAGSGGDDGGGAGGEAFLQGGEGGAASTVDADNGGPGGAATVEGGHGGVGSATALSGDGGVARLAGGSAGTDGGAGAGLGGNAEVDAGAGSTEGDVLIGTSVANSVQLGRAGKTTNVRGSLAIQDKPVVSLVDQFLLGNIETIPDPNTIAIGVTFIAKNALFTAVCVPRPDDNAQHVWWPAQSQTPLNYHPTATNGANANGANRFGNYTAIGNGWVQNTILGQAANGMSLTGVGAGAQMQWMGIGIQQISTGTAIDNGDVLMSNAFGQGILWDGNPANAKLGIALNRLTAAGLAQTLLFTFNP